MNTTKGPWVHTILAGFCAVMIAAGCSNDDGGSDDDSGDAASAGDVAAGSDAASDQDGAGGETDTTGGSDAATEDAGGAGDASGGDDSGAEDAAGPECSENADCAALDGTEVCRVGVCTDGACVLADAPEGTSCDDADACTEGDACTTEATCAGTAITCDDGNVCTTDGCDPSTGCVALPATGTPCDDEDPCTAGETCDDQGTCGGGTPTDCDDGNPCTDDACSAGVGCASTNVADGAACDDGDSCTTGDSCTAGVCGGTNECECAADADCSSKEDGNACNGTLVCDVATSKCVVDPQTVVKCEGSQDSACTFTVCNTSNGQCVPAPKPPGTPCDDGDACTQSDKCDMAGTCAAGENVCACQQDSDCPDDGDKCNGEPSCLINPPFNSCVNVNAPPPCTGGDACNTNACEPSTGQCVATPKSDGTTCDDGDACTSDTTCSAGVCGGGNDTCGVSFSAVYQSVFAGYGCTGCHGKFNGEATAYNTLTGAGTCCGGPCISIGNAATSSIYLKVAPGVQQTCGGKMPQGSSGVSAQDAKLLEDWINGGAKQ